MRLTRRLVAALLSAGTPAAATAQDAIGVITHLTDERSTTLLRNAAVKHVKTTLYWDAWVDRPGYAASFAEGIQRLVAANFEITVVVHSPPAPYNTYANRLAAYQAFANFVGARAAQFPGVRNWQLWNEQDAPGWTPVFGMGVDSTREQGRNYGRMLGYATPAIKKANKHAVVVTGGLGGPDNQIARFVQGIYDVRGPFDVIAVHAYGLPLSLAAQIRGDALRPVVRANGGSKPLWLTEFGYSGRTTGGPWPSDSTSKWDSYQREQWSGLATWNDRTRYYARLVGYVLFDVTDYGYGIVRADTTTLRPAYTWLQQRNGASRQ